MTRIAPADLDDARVTALIKHHLRQAAENSPPGSVFAPDLSGLRDPAVSVWAAWDGETLIGPGASKQLDARHGEVKSMRTAPDHLRRGAVGAMLAHITAAARARGYDRLSRETGANEAFAAARVLYESAGFGPCAPFGDYVPTDFNRCCSKAL